MGEDAARRPQPDDPDTTGLKIVNVEMDAGDLLIFNSLLAHGVRPNHSGNRVRMAQYISMHPADETTRRSGRSASGCGASATTRRAASRATRANGRRSNAAMAKLTPLGEKLLGLKPWH